MEAHSSEVQEETKGLNLILCQYYMLIEKWLMEIWLLKSEW